MSASKNSNSLVGQGEFTSRVAPSEPLTHKGHAPGVMVGNDAAPEFHAEAHPPGTAPAESTFKPNPESEILGQRSTTTEPLDMPGATSGSVHNDNQFGKPAQGQTSTEQHGSKKKDRSGVEGRVTSGYAGVETGDGSVDNKVRATGADV